MNQGSLTAKYSWLLAKNNNMQDRDIIKTLLNIYVGAFSGNS